MQRTTRRPTTRVQSKVRSLANLAAASATCQPAAAARRSQARRGAHPPRSGGRRGSEETRTAGDEDSTSAVLATAKFTRARFVATRTARCVAMTNASAASRCGAVIDRHVPKTGGTTVRTFLRHNANLGSCHYAGYDVSSTWKSRVGFNHVGFREIARDLAMGGRLWCVEAHVVADTFWQDLGVLRSTLSQAPRTPPCTIVTLVRVREPYSWYKSCAPGSHRTEPRAHALARCPQRSPLLVSLRPRPGRLLVGGTRAAARRHAERDMGRQLHGLAAVQPAESALARRRPAERRHQARRRIVAKAAPSRPAQARTLASDP